MYQALYRAYRPRNFTDVAGQEHVTTSLRNTIRNKKLTHAYLFNGPRGTGKTSLAKIFAKALNCQQPVDGEPCCSCDSCLAIEETQVQDIIEIDAASNNGVDEIRQLRDAVKYAPTQLKYKVYIIDEVHMLSIGAFNALLKTLEEPPAHVVFILATTEVHKIPATIISRCQRYDFHRITDKDIIGRIKTVANSENIIVDEDALILIAKLSDGGLRDALSLLDQVSAYANEKCTIEDVYQVAGVIPKEMIANCLRYIITNSNGELLKYFDFIFEQGKNINLFLQELIELLRDILVAKINNQALDDRDDLVALLNNKTIYDLIQILNDCLNEVKYARLPKIIIQVALLKCSNVFIDQAEKNVDLVSKAAVFYTEEKEETGYTIPYLNDNIISQEITLEEDELIIHDYSDNTAVKEILHQDNMVNDSELKQSDLIPAFNEVTPIEEDLPINDVEKSQKPDIFDFNEENITIGGALEAGDILKNLETPLDENYNLFAEEPTINTIDVESDVIPKSLIVENNSFTPPKKDNIEPNVNLDLSIENGSNLFVEEVESEQSVLEPVNDSLLLTENLQSETHNQITEECIVFETLSENEHSLFVEDSESSSTVKGVVSDSVSLFEEPGNEINYEDTVNSLELFLDSKNVENNEEVFIENVSEAANNDFKVSSEATMLNGIIDELGTTATVGDAMEHNAVASSQDQEQVDIVFDFHGEERDNTKSMIPKYMEMIFSGNAEDEMEFQKYIDKHLQKIMAEVALQPDINRLELFRRKWQVIEKDALNPIKSMLADTEPKIATTNEVVVSSFNKALVSQLRARPSQQRVLDSIKEIVGEEYNVVVIDEATWMKQREVFAQKWRRQEINSEQVASLSKEIEYVENEPLQDTVIEGQISLLDNQEDGLVSDALQLFGNDIVEIK